MLRRIIDRIRKTLVNGLTGARDAFCEVVLKKEPKVKVPYEEAPWWESDSVDRPPTTWDKIKNIRKKFTTGPRPLPGSRRMKRIMVALMLPIYIGIILFMLGENTYVEIFFVLTVYILVDYLAITREEDIWGSKKP